MQMNVFCTIALLTAGAVTAGGCVFDDIGNDTAAANGVDDDDESDGAECGKIEDAEIGVEGVTITPGDLTIRFVDWVGKDGEPGEYIGFSVEITGGAADIVVKAGVETFVVTGSSWSHPAGSGGPEVSAVSNVEVCDPPGGDGECNDPDGCDNDGGDGDGDDDGGECNDPDGCDNDVPPQVD